MFAGGADDGCLVGCRALTLGDDHHSAGGEQTIPAPGVVTLVGKSLPVYFLATTMVLIVAVTPSTTSTTTM